MGEGNEKKVARGARLKIPAQTWNAVIDTVMRSKRERFASGPREPLSDSIEPATTIQIQNTVADFEDAYHIVDIANPIYEAEDNPVNLAERISFQGYPVTGTKPIAILASPCANGDTCTAVIAGVTPAYVKMIDESHQWANPVVGVNTNLESSNSPGVARILWHDASGTLGDPWTDTSIALVQIIGAGDCGDFPAEITSSHYDAVTGYAWKLLTLDTTVPGYIDADPPVTGNKLFEVNDNRMLTVGSRLRMRAKSGGYQCQVQEEFPAEITVAFDATNGYEWKELKLAKPTFGVVDATYLKGKYAFDVSDNQNLQVGDKVWIRKSDDGWAIDRAKVRIGCGLKYDAATDTYSVDYDALVGDGLEVAVPPPPPPGPPSPPPCSTIKVTPETLGCGLSRAGGTLHADFSATVVPPLVWAQVGDVCSLTLEYACGLDVDGDDKLAVNLTSVVTDGITWGVGEACSLSWNPGCGMTVGVSPANGNAAIAVNYDALAGTASDTALVVLGTVPAAMGDPCPTLAVDLNTTLETTETLVTDTALSIVAGMLRETKTKVIFTNYFNSAGLLIDRTAGDPVTSYTQVPICDTTECCDAESLSMSCSADSYSVVVGDAVHFTATISGGVNSCEGGYSILWDFGDGTTSTDAEPTKSYDEQGTYTVSVTVTDCCGSVVTCTTSSPITVGSSTPCCETEPTDLCLNITPADGCDPLIDSPVALTRIGPGEWASTSEYAACTADEGWALTCDGGVWSVASTAGPLHLSVDPDPVVTCDPFSVTFTANWVCGICNVDLTLAFTERTGDNGGGGGDPGTECADALEIDADTPYTDTVPPAPAEHWFRFEHTGAHGFMKVIISGSTDASIQCAIYQVTSPGDPECDHIVLFDSFSGNNSVDKNMGSPPWKGFFKIFSTPGATYTLEYQPEF